MFKGTVDYQKCPISLPKVKNIYRTVVSSDLLCLIHLGNFRMHKITTESVALPEHYATEK